MNQYSLNDLVLPTGFKNSDVGCDNMKWLISNNLQYKHRPVKLTGRNIFIV